MTTVNIPNDNCTPEIDIWLSDKYGDVTEHFGTTHNFTYRSFSFTYPEDATMFALKFR